MGYNFTRIPFSAYLQLVEILCAFSALQLVCIEAGCTRNTVTKCAGGGRERFCNPCSCPRTTFSCLPSYLRAGANSQTLITSKIFCWWSELIIIEPQRLEGTVSRWILNLSEQCAPVFYHSHGTYFFLNLYLAKISLALACVHCRWSFHQAASSLYPTIM